MQTPTPLTDLGEFVLVFQAVEEALVELLVLLHNSDPEYVVALTAELEFNGKARALDVTFSRFAQIHGLSSEPTHPEFRKLMSRVQKLAPRRNDIVHSFYNWHITVNGEAGLNRRPTRLKPSEGTTPQEPETLLLGSLQNDFNEIKAILSALEVFRLQAIDILYPSE